MEGRKTVAAPVVTTATQPVNFGDILVNRQSGTPYIGFWTINGQAASDVLSLSSASSPFVSNPPFNANGNGGSIGTTGSYTTYAAYNFAPSATGTQTDVIVGTDASQSGTSGFLTLVGTGVAPVASGPAPTASAGYVLVGQSSSVTLNVSNTGNGNLAGTGTAFNLNGSFGNPSNSVFAGSGTATFSLTDNSKGVTPTSSATYGYTFAPTRTGAVSSPVVASFSDGIGTGNKSGFVTTTLTGTGVAPVESVSSQAAYVRVGTSGSVSLVVANTGNGNLAGTGTAYNLNGSVSSALGPDFAALATNPGTISLASNATPTTASTATSTLGYTYTPTARGTDIGTVNLAFSNGNANGTNLSQSVTATLTGVGVGPVYASATSVAGGSATTNTPSVKGTNGTVGPAGATISFGTLAFNRSQTVYLELKNISNDPLAAGNLTDLTIEGYSVSGGDASAVTVAPLSPDQVISEGGMLVIPITVINNLGVGSLNSTLTIFTDESVAMGGNGDTFTYSLAAIDIPEPASLAVLGAGLAGLAWIRRRRSE